MSGDTTGIPRTLAIGAALAIVGAWLVYFVVAPTVGFDLLDSWHNEQRALQVVLLLGTALGFAGLLLAIPTVRVTGLLWVVLALGVLSAAVADLPVHAAAEVASSALLLILGAFVATLLRQFGRQGSAILLYGACLIGAVCVVGVAANLVGVVAEQRRVDLEALTLGFANPRFPTALHALILPLILWLAIDPTQKRSLRIACWVVAVSLWAIDLALGTRAIWAAFAASGIAFWYWGGQAGRRVVKPVIISAVAGAIIYVAILLLSPAALPDSGAMHSRGLGTSSSRTDLWLAALAAIFDHPLLGIGPMHFAELGAAVGAHPHNWPLQLASEWGLPALALILVLVFRWMRSLRAALVSRDVTVGSDALPPIGLSVLTAFAYGFVDGNWVMPVSQSFAVILLGASIGLMPARESVPVRRVLTLQSCATVAVVFAASCALGWYTYHTVGLQRQREIDYVRRVGVDYFFPRFWQQGMIGEKAADAESKPSGAP